MTEADPGRPAPPTRPPADDDPGFGVYVHWPFCLSKCPYCDFNGHVRSAAGRRTALSRRLRRGNRPSGGAGAGAGGRGSIFFGGGTPSLMQPEERSAASSRRSRPGWPIAPDAEITLEANPTSVEAGRFRSYRAAGVNRLSIGVQALADADLLALGAGTVWTRRWKAVAAGGRPCSPVTRST